MNEIIFAIDTNNKVEEVKKSVNYFASETIMPVDGVGVVPPPYSMNYLSRLFDFNSTHKFCIELKTNLVCGLGYEIKRGTPKKIKDFLDQITLHKTLSFAFVKN